MSCLSVRFSPARKAWKKFTSKLQTNLRKLQGSRPMKRHSNRGRITAKKGEITALAVLEQRRRKKRVKRKVLFNFLVKKKAAPVYIDRLFKEPVSVLEFGASIRDAKAKCSSPLSEIPGTSSQVGLASPLMYGIDARAEEFIKRFRAEMKNQEMLDRDL